MVGNPVFFCGTGSNSTIQVDIFYWHGLVSYENYQAYLNNGCNANPNSGTCSNIINSMLVSLLLLFCSKTVPSLFFSDTMRLVRLIRKFLLLEEMFSTLQALILMTCIKIFVSVRYLKQLILISNKLRCFEGNASLDYTSTISQSSCNPIGDEETAYLNRKDVQNSIHAIGSLAAAPWAACSSAINYQEVGASMVPHYQKFQSQKRGFRVLVYSGVILFLFVVEISFICV